MSKKQSNDIGDILLEIALAVTPIILGIVFNWLQSDDETDQ